MRRDIDNGARRIPSPDLVSCKVNSLLTSPLLNKQPLFVLLQSEIDLAPVILVYQQTIQLVSPFSSFSSSPSRPSTIKEIMEAEKLKIDRIVRHNCNLLIC